MKGKIGAIAVFLTAWANPAGTSATTFDQVFWKDQLKIVQKTKGYCRLRCLRHVAFTLGLFLLLLSQPPGLAAEFSGKVIGVSDGDTIIVLSDGHPVKVRLARIDCPEKRQAYGQAAKRFTAAECFGKVVTVKEHGHDRYARLIGEIILPSGNSLNEKLVQNGLAWQYRKYSNDPILAGGEQQARDSNCGLWSQPNPVPPWNYRKLAHQNHRQLIDWNPRR